MSNALTNDDSHVYRLQAKSEEGCNDQDTRCTDQTAPRILVYFCCPIRALNLAVHPGQDIEYVVVDGEKISRERVALVHEKIESYDASYYETELVRAVESVLSPMG